MKKRSMILWLIAIGIVMGTGGFLLGRKTVLSDKNADDILNWMQCDTIYVTILEKQDFQIRAEGLSVNDINGQGEFVFSIDPETNLIWRGTTILEEALQEGDIIAVTYDGQILEQYPAQICHVLQIKKLS